jgi:hypothetical protein
LARVPLDDIVLLCRQVFEELDSARVDGDHVSGARLVLVLVCYRAYVSIAHDSKRTDSTPTFLPFK